MGALGVFLGAFFGVDRLVVSMLPNRQTVEIAETRASSKRGRMESECNVALEI